MSICNRCERDGFAIFPVLYGVLPIKKASARCAPIFGQDKLGKNVTELALKDYLYHLKGIEPGYIYILLPTKKYIGYLVDPKGYLQYYPDLTVEDMGSIPEKSNVESCTTKGHNSIRARFLTVPSNLEGDIWIAYSRTPWTKAVRASYAADPSVRMQKISRTDGEVFEHALAGNAENIKQHVLNFQHDCCAQLNEDLPDGRKIIPYPEDVAAKLEAEMLAMHRGYKKGVMLALWDPIGITIDLNHARNMVAQKLFGVDKSTPQQEREDLLVAAIIKDLEEGMIRGGPGKKEPSKEGQKTWQKHAEYLDAKKYAAAKNKIQEREGLAQQADDCSANYVKWMTSKQTNEIFKNDFDPASEASGCFLELYFAACIEGSGNTAIERKEIWKKWFDTDTTAAENLLWKAATANDKDLIEYISWEKIDKTYDTVKGGKDIAKEAAWVQHLVSAHHTFVAKRRYFTTATAAIATTLTAQMIWLKSADPIKFERTAAQLASVFLVRGDVLLVKQVVTAPVRHFYQGLLNLTSTRPMAPRAPLRPSPLSTPTGSTILAADVVDAAARHELAGGSLRLDLGDTSKIRQFAIYLARRLNPTNGSPDPRLNASLADLRISPSAAMLEDPLASTTTLTDEGRTVKFAKVDRVFSFGVSIMLFISMSRTIDDMLAESRKGEPADKAAADEKAEKLRRNQITLGCTALSAVAVGMDIRAANLVIGNAGVVSLQSRALNLGAGLIGVGVCVVDAYYLWVDSEKLKADGDKDAADYTLWAAGAMGVAAVSGVVGAGMAFFGVTGPAVMIVLAITVVAVVVSVCFSYMAAEATPAPLQIWLDRCRFGARQRTLSKDKPLTTFEAEMKELREAIYFVAIAWRPDTSAVGFLGIDVSIVVPFYGTQSTVEFEITGVDPLDRVVSLKTLRLEKGKLQPLGAKGKGVTRDDIEVTLQDSVLKISGTLKTRGVSPQLTVDKQNNKLYRSYSSPTRVANSSPNSTGELKDVTDREEYFKAAKLVVRYIPDGTTWPDFVIENSK